MAEEQVRTPRGTIDEIRARAAGLHFAKEALTPGEREILYDLEAAISMLDGFTTSGFFRGYRSEITADTPRPQLRLTDLPPDPTSTVAGERLVLPHPVRGALREGAARRPRRQPSAHESAEGT